MQAPRASAARCTSTQHVFLGGTSARCQSLVPSRRATNRNQLRTFLGVIGPDIDGLLPLLSTSSIVFGMGTAVAWQLANSRAQTAESEVQLLKSKVQDRDQELKKLDAQVNALQDRLKQTEFYKGRLDEASKEQLKLERALEMKDGQLESFMVVAQRQIKMLEDRCKELSSSK